MGKFNIQLFCFSLAMLCLAGVRLSAQPNDRWKAGSALELRNTVQTLYCFVETAESPWTEEEKLSVRASLDQAQQWLISQANEWNIPLKFNTNEFIDGKSIVLPQVSSGTGSGKERVDWVIEIAQKTGFRNARQAYKKLSRKYHNPNLYLVIFAHTDGTSYGLRFAQRMSKKKYFLEGILVYEHYYNGANMPVPSVIAHEILHLYGAWDLYTTYAQTVDRQTKARLLFPHDIMLRVGYDMQTIRVDKLTAWLVGWNTNEEELYEWFRPTDFKK